MADDEQFSLCWNNFNSNLSAGFHESLCRGDLVDVTLAAEGQLVKAHRLVLSVCSPYFRKMFTQMPANQHAFVFLKDVSHAALKDLIQFMYCGEVNVKQDALPAFISTAEALQIKGLTETGDSTPAPQQTHHQPAPPSPVKEMPPLVASTPITLVHQSPRQPTHRVVQQRQRQQTYKTLDSEGSSDEKVIIHQMSQKRPAPKILSPASAPAIKRVKQQQQIQQIAQTATKSTADPLESSAPIQIITSQSITASSSVHPEPKSIAGDTEFIDLPDETINPKTEPEFEEQDDDQADQHEQLQHEIEQESENDQDQQYAEDNNSTYGSIKYDESYFATEEASGGEVKAGVSTMSISGVNEIYATEGGEPSNAEAQGRSRRLLPKPLMMEDATDSPQSEVQHYKTMTNPVVVRKNPKKIRNNLLRLGKIRVGDIIKQLSNGHALICSVMLTDGRSGYCVYCTANQTPGRNELSSFCPACRGCSWVCENCFDKLHNVIDCLD